MGWDTDGCPWETMATGAPDKGTPEWTATSDSSSIGKIFDPWARTIIALKTTKKRAAILLWLFGMIVGETTDAFCCDLGTFILEILIQVLNFQRM